MPDLSWVETRNQDVRLHLVIQPRASRSAVLGLYDGRLKVAINAPPVEGEANKELISFLAKRLKLPRASLRIVSGETGRRKTVEVCGISPEQVASLLLP